MKKIIKIAVVMLFAGLIGVQFIRPTRVNPPVIATETLEATTDVPKHIAGILKRSCMDCHSNLTNFPWYSNIAPISWSVVDHIEGGREELNFSKWGTYKETRKARKLQEICKEVTSRDMPHNQYLWIHWEAKLSDRDIKDLCAWTKSAGDKLSN